MSQAYSNPDREHEPHALPDIEVFKRFYINCSKCGSVLLTDSGYYSCSECERMGNTERTEQGWFYWFCFPGCLPDSDPNGPFPTKAEALADAQSNND